jgi:hypothetical protein
LRALAQSLAIASADGDIANPDDLYALAHAVPWHHHFGGDDRCYSRGQQIPAFRDTRFALLRVKMPSPLIS